MSDSNYKSLLNRKFKADSWVKSIISAFLFVLIVARLYVIPEKFGYDLDSTRISFPYEVAGGYGLWYFAGSFFGYLGIGFSFFWIFTAVIFGVCFRLYLSYCITESITSVSFLSITFYLLVFGYFIPWYVFAHIRFGAALFLCLAAINSARYRLVFFAIAAFIHSLMFIFIGVFYLSISKIPKFISFTFIVLICVLGFFYREQLFVASLSLLTYDNYTNDLLQFEADKGIAMMLFRGTILLILSFFLIKKDSKIYFNQLVNIVYLAVAINTPFSGRIVEFLYPSFLCGLGKKKSLFYLLLITFLLVECYFAIQRGIFRLGTQDA